MLVLSTNTRCSCEQSNLQEVQLQAPSKTAAPLTQEFPVLVQLGKTFTQSAWLLVERQFKAHALGELLAFSILRPGPK